MGRYFHHSFISDYSDNTFSSGFQIEGEPEHYKVSVKLRSSKVEFVYYDVDDIKHPVTPGQVKPLFFIELDDHKLLDNFLLEIRDKKLKQEIVCDNADNKLFYIDMLLEQKSKFNSSANIKEVTIFELLLCFFDDLNNPESDFFRYSPKTADKIKSKFEKSFIYRLIIAKYKIYANLKDWFNSGKSEYFHRTLKNSAARYLAMLMDDNLIMDIPEEYFSENGWFDIPENEVELLLKVDKILSDYNQPLFNRVQNNQIQAFFYRKHSVIAAWRQRSAYYKIPIIGHTISLIIFVFLFIIWLHEIHNINSDILDKVFETTGYVLSIGLAILLITLIVQWITQGRKFMALLPRILVSVAAAWAVLAPSEELIKNLIAVEQNLLIGIMIALPLLIYFVIYAQCRSKSPYYRAFKHKNAHDYKSLPILIFVFNVSVLFGGIGHHFIVNDFIRSSNSIPEHVFSAELGQLRRDKEIYINYTRQLDITITHISAAKRYLVFTEYVKSTDTLLLTAVSQAGQTADGHYLFQEESSIFEMYNKYIESLKKINIALIPKDNIHYQTSLKKYTAKNEQHDFQYKYNFLVASHETLYELKNEALENISSLDSFILAFNDKLAFHILTNQNNWMENFGIDFQTNNDVKYLSVSSIMDNYYFPRMLIIQVFIAMFISVIGNLIVSGKMITEGL